MEATTILLIAVTVSIAATWYVVWIRKRSNLPSREETTPKECSSTKTISYWTVDDKGSEIHIQRVVPIDDDSPTVSDRYIEHLKRNDTINESD